MLNTIKLNNEKKVASEELVRKLSIRIIGKTKCERYKKRNAIIRV